MNEHSVVDFNVRTIAPILAIGSLVLCLVGFTDIETRFFQFFTGEVAMVTAIAYSFQKARGVNKFAHVWMVLWVAVASVNFVRAIWLTA